MDPTNFVVSTSARFEDGGGTESSQNASWIINSLKVYKKQGVFGEVSGTHAISTNVERAFVYGLVGAAVLLLV
jgi:hypothetical protein